MFRQIALCSLVGLGLLCSLQAEVPVWPTSGTGFARGEPWENFIQPTESELPYSGLFGSTREKGTRFHEGIDIRAERRDAQGRAQDAVYAFLSGRVVHVNRQAEKSSYGLYVVIEHRNERPVVYSLYAHLANIAPGIEPEAAVEAGTRLGTMGESSGGYTIPIERAHLHFEIGLRLSDDFQAWYDRQDFKDANDHGLWNGMNLIGINPLKYFGYVRGHGSVPMAHYLREVLKTAFILRVFTEEVPDFIRRYPQLLTERLPRGGVAGWEIAFTWYGLPKRWTPLPRSGHAQRTGVEVVRYESEPLFSQQGRRMLIKEEDGSVRIGSHLAHYLEILFGPSLL